MRSPSRPTSVRRGAVAVEAALVLPVLLMLTFGLIEFGHYLYLQHMIKGAAQAGARTAIPAGVTNDATARTAISDMMSAAGIDPGQYSVSFSPAVSAATPGTRIEVSISCTWQTVGIRPLGLISPTKQVRGFAVMQKE